MNRIVIEDWYLQKEYQATGVWFHDKGQTGGYILDDKEFQTAYRLVGTQQQIADWSNKQEFIVDEVYTFTAFEKDSYWEGICFSENCKTLPTREEYNKEYYKKLKEYSKLYKENDKKVLVLRIN